MKIRKITPRRFISPFNETRKASFIEAVQRISHFSPNPKDNNGRTKKFQFVKLAQFEATPKLIKNKCDGNEDNSIKIKFTHRGEIKPRLPKKKINTVFSKYIEDKISKVNFGRTERRKSIRSLAEILPRDNSVKRRYGFMKLLKAESQHNNDKVPFSHKSIYKLANKFRSKYKGGMKPIKEISSPKQSSKFKTLKTDAGGANYVDVMKYNYNLNESSSDSMMSDDYDAKEDDIFMTNTVNRETRLTTDLKKSAKKHIKNRVMKLDSLSMGDDYIETISDLMKRDNNLEMIQLGNNRMGTRGAMGIFDKISDSCQFLDISYNPEIKRDAYKFLSRYVLKDYRKKITELDLEGNQIGDKSLAIICDGLCGDSSIKCLNLSKNCITDESGVAISEMLEINISLTALFLSWNEIKGEGIIKISKGLQINNTIKVLDLSFNAFGSMHTQKVKGVVALSRALAVNSSIVHIDLSYVGLDHEDCDILNEGLKKNHSILGIHMLGNMRGLDAKGFCSADVVPPSAAHVYKRVDKSLKAGEIDIKDLDLNISTNCWVCEGWSPMTFKFRLECTNMPHVKIEPDDDVLVHLSIDQFMPDLMKLDKEIDGEYHITRMVPPVAIQYYFSVQGIPMYRVDTDSEAATTTKFPALKVLENKGESIPWRVNISPPGSQNNVVIDMNFLDKIECKPRPKIYEPKVVEELELKPAWKKETSVFKTYRIDNTEILDNCFEVDWEYSKIPVMIKNEEERMKIRAMIKQNYRLMRECYRYYAGSNPCGIIPCIGQNAFNEIISATGIVDQSIIKLSDIDFEFIVTKSGSTKNTMNPERWLIRYQFMEIFVRIALHKYHKSKKVESQYEAVELLWHEHLLPYFVKFDCHKWRLDNLWNIECDEIFVKYNNLLRKLFDKYSVKYVKPSKPKFVSIDEFITMISESGTLRYEVGHGNSVIGSQFNLAMMTHVDEIDKDDHLKMFYEEFLEAIARVADRIKIFPNIDYYNKRIDKANKATPSKKAEVVKDEKNDESDHSKYEDSDFEDELSPKSPDSANHKSKKALPVNNSLIINVEGAPLHIKLEIIIKLCEFTLIKGRNFYEIYED